MLLRVSRTIGAAPSDRGLIAPDLAGLMALAGTANRLRGWQIRADARQRGDYRAPMRGRGMEYAESRPYQAGDDVRVLDWRLTARIGKPHTKLFREEREHPVCLGVDLGPTHHFATRGVFKRVQAARAAALLAWKAVREGDRIGAVVGHGGRHETLLPGRGNPAAVQVLKALARQGGLPLSELAEAPTSLVGLLRGLAGIARPGALVFVITDGLGLDEPAWDQLAEIRRRCQTALIIVRDPLELSLPPMYAPLRLRDVHGKEGRLTLSPAACAAYADTQAAALQALEQQAREQRCPVALLMTDGNPFDAVQALMKRSR